MTEPAVREPIPWRRYYAAIFAVVSVIIGALLVFELRRIVTWVVIAVFFAVVLSPLVDRAQQRLHLSRALAVVVVMLALLIAVVVAVAVIVHPLVTQAQRFATELPTFVSDARAGRGPLGGLVRRYNLDEWLRNNEATLHRYTSGLGTTGLHLLRTVGDVVVAALTMFVLTVLLLFQGPKLVDGILATVSPRHRDRVRRVGHDCSHAVTGYVAGNLLISVIAGGAVYIYLWATGVPFKGVLALWVGFADLIPLVGATLGAVPVVLVAFLHSVPVGIGAIVFFLVYQQFENHVLQVTIMARTVKLNALAVLLSVLIGVELMGITGALLAIPVAGALQVIWRDLYDERRRLHLAGERPDEITAIETHGG